MPHKDPQRRQAYVKSWAAANKDRKKATNRDWHARNRARLLPSMRNNRLKRLYGITLDEKEALLASQGGCCAVCLSPSPGAKHGWHVDHDHRTGVVRGILCHSCNIAVGRLGDNYETAIERTQQILRYLQSEQS